MISFDAYAVDGSDLTLQDATTKCSFFSLIEDRLWTRHDDNDDRAIHRIFSLARRMRVQSLLIEELTPNQEIEDEKDMLRRYYGKQDLRVDAFRVSLFSLSQGMDLSDLGLDDKTLNDRFIGYAVIVRVHEPDHQVLSYILEAVVRKPGRLPPDGDDQGKERFILESNYYVHAARTFSLTIGTSSNHRELKVEGSFFCQQNGRTSTCFHAGIRMAVNNLPESVVGNKLTNKFINEQFSDEYGNESTRPSLKQRQRADIVKKLGLHSVPIPYIQADVDSCEADRFERMVYAYMESGFPVILDLSLRDPDTGNVSEDDVSHCVVVVGHTLNADRWSPEARIAYDSGGSRDTDSCFSSLDWVDHWIINDDNYGMYTTLPTDAAGLHSEQLPGRPNLRPVEAVAFKPEGVNLSSRLAEGLSARFAGDILRHESELTQCRWFERMKLRPLVHRLQLYTGEAYRRHIEGLLPERYLDTDNELAEGLKRIPDLVWVCEFSLPNVYTANKAKLGDLVIDAALDDEAAKKNPRFNFSWFPGVYCFGDGCLKSWPLTTHYPMIDGASR